MAAAASVLVALGALTACDSSDDGSDDAAKPSQKPSQTAPSSTPSASPSPQSNEGQAEDQLLAAYRAYWSEKATAYAKGTMADTRLKSYAKGNALGQAIADLRNLKTAGQLTTGEPVLKPRVSSLDLKKKVPLARITDCVDVEPWKAIDRKTRAEVQLPKERRLKYVSHVTAERWGKQWVILEVKPENRAC
ncbi:hypothetical protein ACIG3E_23385 [Streptomyces sp. NPDC053474]|uniref:hypothetical protein n=1 Tax=Streptomyces sp. NPDC053474 TaxID=3365704 RepID=UPI0037CDDE37